MIALVLLLAAADTPKECANPPSRSASRYWEYVDACGCALLEPPPEASADHERYRSACSRWRERNPSAGAASPQPQAVSRECENPPARASVSFWSYLESCGCARTEPPPAASSDYSRYLQTCGDWRVRNPAPAPAPSATPRPSPSAGTKK